jgi:hypothetical protein
MAFKIVGNLYTEYKQTLVKDIPLSSTSYGIPGLPTNLLAIGEWTSTDVCLGTTVYPHKAFRGIYLNACSSDETCVVEMVKTYDIIEADMSTATVSTDFIPGTKNIMLSTAGSNTSSTGSAPLVLPDSTLVASTAVLEHAYILAVDDVNDKVRFYFEKLSTGA